jgi:flap endonuclease-1
MGVEGLNQYLLHNVPKESKSIQKIYTNQLKGKKIAIDASIYIYKFFVNNNYIILSDSIYKMIDDFVGNRVTPIFIFDGKPPKLKDYIINKRRKEKDIAEQAYQNVDNPEIKGKLEKQFIRPNKDTIDFVKRILNKRNIKYIDALNEADPLCAWLVKTGKVWACLSDDTDMFIYGSPRVLRSYSINTKSLMLYDFDKILKQLKVSFDEFREICVISGTDYNITEHNIHITKVFKLFYDFRKEGNVRFIDWLIDNHHITDDKEYYTILELMDINNMNFTAC